MATLLKCGGLFLHVPKTGGNWVSDVLEANGLAYAHVGGKHAGPSQLAPLYRLLDTPRRYDRANLSLFSFCFVRHPLRWYESWFRMNVARGWPVWPADADVWNPSVELNGLGAATFEQFIENVVAMRPGFLTRLYDSYAGDAHFVGRQEHMVDDLTAVLRVLAQPFDENAMRAQRPVNVGAPVDVALSASLQRSLEASERVAYERYGYTSTGIATPSVPCSRLSLPATGTSLAGPFAPDSGFAWRCTLHGRSTLADTEDAPTRSMLRLTENGVPLPWRHASHEAIRQTGLGRFSHWHDMILFSTSDNTDPNLNGRRYEFDWTLDGRRDGTCLLLDSPEHQTRISS